MRREAQELALVVLLSFVGASHAAFPGIGRAATADEIAAWDIDVRGDFKGLPAGSGSVAKGQQVWESKCATCHGTFGESNEVFPPLVGGTTAEDVKTGHAKALVTGDQARTTIMKLAKVSTLWDYVRRAMPWNAPKTLSTDEVYSVVAYILNLADLVPDSFVLSQANMAEVQARLPNRNGLTPKHGLGDIRGKPDVKNVACMRDCPTQAKVESEMPDYAKGTHGDLAAQNRAVGATRGATTAPATPAKAAAPRAADLAQRSNCLACHAVDRQLIGPAFKDVAARYKGQADAPAKLAQKVRQGGSGNWGSVPMPPHPNLREDDLATLVRWVLGGGI